MAGKKRIKRKRTMNRSTALALLVITIVVVFMMGNNLTKMVRLSRQKSDLEKQIAAKEEESKDLDEVLEKKDEKSNIENRARQLLGLYYPDEKLVVPIDNKGKIAEVRKFEQSLDREAEIDEAKVFRLNQQIPKETEENEDFE